MRLLDVWHFTFHNMLDWGRVVAKKSIDIWDKITKKIIRYEDDN